MVEPNSDIIEDEYQEEPEFLEQNIEEIEEEVKQMIEGQISEEEAREEVIAVLRTEKNFDWNLDRNEAGPRVSEEGENELVNPIEETKTPINLSNAPVAKKGTKYAIEDIRDISLFPTLVPIPIITYPFELDVFQKRAIMRLEERSNVFVAAHTSAGKTVVAEYAIALAKMRKGRVIYTSPIKALSNQKYREFKNTFEDVGILTGDVSVDPDASCVIMTTEVLRSMLYNGSSRLRDLEWVILDEVHYINDVERGVVWEEVLIMLPPYVRIVMLSATVPNYMEFSDWVGRVRQQAVYVQITYQRPTPLEHIIYAQGEFFRLMDDKGNYHEENYEKAIKKLSSYENRGKNAVKRKDKDRRSKSRYRVRGKTEDQQYKDLILSLQKLKLLPCVVFAFSRDKVDHRGEKLSQVCLLNKAEKHIVMQFTKRAISRLNPIDRELPQIKFVLSLLSNGIGVHHSGILPILKEIVEILFSKGLIKVLVATETFAMGLNMPTRTVVFCELKKFDGHDHRYLNPGEYTQMAGRAGRRGKDTKGSVIMFFKDSSKIPSSRDLNQIMHSEPRKLESKFRIRYNQICNVLNTEGMSMEDLVSKSFLSNSTFMNLNEQTQSLMLDKSLEDMERRYEAGELGAMMEFLGILREIIDISAGFNQLGKKPGEGYFVEVLINGSANLPGVMLNKGSKISCLVFDCNGIVPTLPNQFPGGKWGIEEISLTDLITIYKGSLTKKHTSSLRIKQFSPEWLQEVLALLYKSRSDSLSSSQIYKEKSPLHAKKDELVLRLLTHPCFNDPSRHEIFIKSTLLFKYREELEKIERAKEEERKSSSLESDCRINLLKQFNYVDANLIVELKGRVLGIFNNPYNFVIVELLFNGIHMNLTEEELAAVTIIFVTEEKNKTEDKNWEEVSPGLKNAISMIENLVETLRQKEKDLEIKSEMDEKIKLGLVEVAYLWAKGKPFIDICGITDIKEGNIVRGILRLHDLLGKFVEAAEIMGDGELDRKAKAACELIKRDIAFATSLYISI
ncbi:unnamed protein product [Blepharisma stoltei]|uniref:Helicase n=1 Tax=Blepharisma stoltei TaxID=1481888 RepID=A0AAU9IXQ7_9CILI|nr:unnamed protein product [Blepharisma stoltei]